MGSEGTRELRILISSINYDGVKKGEKKGVGSGHNQ